MACIQVNTFSWKVTNAASTVATGGSGGGKANFGNLMITKTIDSATTPLFTACAGGVHIATGTLSLVKAGSGGQPYFKADMTEVFITSQELDGPNTETAVEVLTMSYRSIQFTYLVQGTTGTVTAKGVGGWNVATNAKM